MQRIKLVVIFSFFVVIGLLLLNRPANVSGQGSLGAPTGVTATDSQYVNKVGVYWDAIRGATLYRVYRNTTNNSGTATAVGTTAANYFFDESAAAGQTYFYWVKAENGANASGFSSADQGTRAAGEIGSTPFPPLDPPIIPAENPITAAKAYLGKALFWDEQLSSTGTVSCGTCHRGAAGGSDPRTFADPTRSRNPGFDNTFNTGDDVFGSPGVPQNNADGTYTWNNLFKFKEQVTGRKAPSYLNAGYTRGGIFWDGRAADIFRDPVTNAPIIAAWGGLESQALGPPLSAAEMSHGNRNWTQAASKIAASRPLALASNIPTALQTWIGGRTYPQLFEEAFGTPEVTPARIAMAIGTHERVLFSDQTPLDKAEAGITPLTPQELNGRNVYIKAQCGICHGGSLLSDNNFHNIGVRPQNEDLGRGAITGIADDNGRFKTPTLRNVELRAPFMHNGRLASLEEVVEFYNRGGDFDAPNINRDIIRPLNLTAQEKTDLVAFMKRPLTDPRVANEQPPFDRPQLYSESTRVPVLVGTGVSGAGGFVPAAVAIEPPLVGNDSFTVAVSNALGGAQAVLVVDAADPGTASIPSSGSFARQQITLAGAGAGAGSGSISLAIPNNPALVGQTFFGRWYVTDAAAANGFSVSQAFRFTVFGEAASARAGFVDFDGDRKTDISIFRPSLGEWWYQRSSNAQTSALQFGASTDKIVPADYTGDGKTDIAVWRPATGFWFVLRSEDNSFFSAPFGASGDVPAAGDFDADGKADLTVFRPSTATWFAQTATQGTVIIQFGLTGDVPQTGDYDGDGKTDFAVFRPSDGSWWYRRSADSQVRAFQFGVSTDKPLAQDYTGDGRTDIAVFRPSTGEWFVLRSEDSSFYSFPFGISSDTPTPGDYDGDGKSDAAVFRPSQATWYVNRSSQGLLILGFGANGDRPVPNAYVP